MQTSEAVPLPAPQHRPDKVMLSRAEHLAILAEMFLPHMSEVIRPMAKRGIAALMTMILQNDEPAIKELVESVKKGEAPRERVKALQACGIGLKTVSVAVLKRNHERSIADVVETASMALACGWLEMFPPPGNIPTLIDADALDGSMMPALDMDREVRFEDSCIRAHLTVEQARGVLAKVRASLPPGSKFPDAAAEFLGASVMSVS